MRRLAILAATAVATLAAAAPAMASTYLVTGTNDVVGQTTGCQATNLAFNCPTLRDAVSAANGHTGADAILVGSATYNVTQPTALQITDDVTITGQGARISTILSNGAARVFTINAGVAVTIAQVTISGGALAGAAGGNIANAGTLTLDHVHLTHGSAASGAGIASDGYLDIESSLIDANTATADGGAITSFGTTGRIPAVAHLVVRNSTIAFNTAASGAGISVRGNDANDARLVQVTLARNSGGGIAIGDKEQFQAYGSIVADNAGGNCSATRPGDGGGNVEDHADCGFTLANADPQLSAALTTSTGPTDVLTIAATSPAIDHVVPCELTTDQRDAPRAAAACDAGAYEYDGPPAPPPPQPTVSPAPTPAPTATSTPPPPPVPTFHKTVVITPVSGKVLVRIPPSKVFVPVSAADGIPLGAEVDTRNGVITLTSVPKAGGKPQTSKFWDGLFKVTQVGSITDLALSETLASCKATKATAAAAKKKPKTRKLWGDGSGSFRTRGQYSAATVRGTKWLVEDECAGTLTRVVRGVVSVRDNVKRKTITLKAGKRYLARPKR
jgi:hypothetical protein